MERFTSEEGERFRFRMVDRQDQEMMERVYRLRYQVYCKECGFLREEDYPQQKESDEYDQQSLHFVAQDTDGEIIGTMRMILPGFRVLPVVKHCPQIKIPDQSLKEVSCAEISRLVISKDLRRRKNDGHYYEPMLEDEKPDPQKAFFRKAKPMAFGLYREMYRESKKRGITHWYTLMEKSLWLLLRIHGFNFACIGEEVDVYGPVKPYIGKLDIIEKEVAKKFPKFFSYFSKGIDQIIHNKNSE